jgi:hypothetical protein
MNNSELDALSIPEFCLRNSISTALFFKLPEKAEGLASCEPGGALWLRKKPPRLGGALWKRPPAPKFARSCEA